MDIHRRPVVNVYSELVVIVPSTLGRTFRAFSRGSRCQWDEYGGGFLFGRSIPRLGW